MEQGVTFNQETTLCGHVILKNIQRAKQDGYLIEMHYVGVDSPETAKQRIAKRVELGGHGIPEQDVEVVVLSKQVPLWYQNVWNNI